MKEKSIMTPGRKMFCLVLVMLFVSMWYNTSNHVYAAPKAYNTAYKKLLKKRYIKAGSKRIKPDWYYIINVDRKGSPELIVTPKNEGFKQNVFMHYVFTYSKNKIKYVGSYKSWRLDPLDEPFVTYSKKKRGLYELLASLTWNEYKSTDTLMIIKNNKLKTKYQAGAYSKGNSYTTHWIGKKSNKVSEKKYYDYCNKMRAGTKAYRMKRVK